MLQYDLALTDPCGAFLSPLRTAVLEALAREAQRISPELLALSLASLVQAFRLHDFLVPRTPGMESCKRLHGALEQRALALAALGGRDTARPSLAGSIALLCEFSDPRALSLEVVHALGPHIARAGERLSPSEVARVAKSYARAEIPSGAVLHVLELRSQVLAASFPPSDLAVVSFALASLGRRAPAAFAALGERALACAEEMSREELMDVLWASEVVGNDSPPGLRPRLEQLIIDRAEKGLLAGEVVAAALSRFSSMPEPAPRIIALLEPLAADLAGDMSPAALCAAMGAVARLGLSPEPLLTTAVDYVVARLSDFRPQELVSAVQFCAASGYPAATLFSNAAPVLRAHASKFSGSTVAAALWAYTTGATGRGAHPLLLQELTAEVPRVTPGLSPHELPNTARSLVRAGLQSRDGEDEANGRALEAVAKQAASCAPKLSMQGLGVLVRALAVSGRRNPVLTDALDTFAAEVELRAYELDPYCLANIARAYAAMAHPSPSMLEVLGQQAIAKAPLFSPPQLAATLWAFSHGDQGLADRPELVRALARQTVRRAVDFNPTELSAAALAFSRATDPPAEVFEALGEQAVMVADSFSHHNLSVTVRAYAAAGRAHPALFHALGQQALLMAESFSPRSLAAVLWAYARVGIARPRMLFLALGVQASLKVGWDTPLLRYRPIVGLLHFSEPVPWPAAIIRVHTHTQSQGDGWGGGGGGGQEGVSSLLSSGCVRGTRTLFIFWEGKARKGKWQSVKTRPHPSVDQIC